MGAAAEREGTVAVVSRFTPEEVGRDLQCGKDDFATVVRTVEIRGIGDCENLSSNSTAILDFLYSSALSRSCLSALSTSSRIVSGNPYEVHGATPFFSTAAEEYSALLTLITFLSVSRLCVFTSHTSSIFPMLAANYTSLSVFVYIVTERLEQQALVAQIRKEVKPQGFSAYFIDTGEEMVLRLMAAMDLLKLTDIRLSVFLTSHSAKYRFANLSSSPPFYSTGPTFLVTLDCQHTSTRCDYFLCEVEKSLEPHSRQFAVVTLNSGETELIGSLNSSHIELHSLPRYWSRGTTVLEVPTLTFSINNGTINPSGEGGTSEYYIYLGAQQALRDLSADDTVLSHYRLRAVNVSLGLFEFDRDWAKSQLQAVQRSDLGVAFISGAHSSVSVGVYRLFEALGIQIPTIGASNTAPQLSSPQDFPLFTRVSMSDAYMSVLYGRMLQQYGWRRVVLIYSDDDAWSSGLYRLILNETEKRGITVENKLRMVGADVSGNWTKYAEVFTELIATKVRIAILLLYGAPLYASLGALYDLGMRRGDLVFLATEWLESFLFSQKDAELQMKIRELCHGVLQFYPAVNVGALGQSVKRRYQQAYSRDPPFYACYYYDSIYLLAHVLSDLVYSGSDYDNPAVLNRAIRHTKFQGCTGTVALAEGTNDRYPMMYTIFNSRVLEGENYEIASVGTYDPSGIVLFTFSSPIVWPDNTTETPSDLRVSEFDCPFEEKSVIRNFTPGLLLSYGLMTFLGCVMIVETVIVWRKRWTSKPLKEMVRAEISFDDYIHFLSIWFEALQYASLGPTFNSWSQFLSKLGWYISLEMQRSEFWLELQIVIGIVGLWFTLLTVKKRKLDENLPFLCGKVGDLGEKILPLLGNVCYVPIISVLFNIFHCEEAAGNSPTSTYLRQDCYQFCWVFPHALYAVLSGVLLLLYTLSVVWQRPAWQCYQPYLHVSTSCRYLMQKTIYQVTITLLEKTVKSANRIAHISAFFVLTLSFAVITVYQKPYNYSRWNLWHSASYIVLLWLTVLALVDQSSEVRVNTVYLSVFALGVAGVVGGALALQWWKAPAKLYRREGPRVVDLLRLMVSRGQGLRYLISGKGEEFTRTGSEKRVPTVVVKT